MTDLPSPTASQLEAEVPRILASNDISAPSPIELLLSAAERRGQRQRVGIIVLIGIAGLALTVLVLSLVDGGALPVSSTAAAAAPAGTSLRASVSFWDVLPTLIGDVWLSATAAVAGFGALCFVIRWQRCRVVARPLRRLTKTVLVVLGSLIALVVGVRLSLQVYHVPSESMAPTILVGSRVVVAENDTQVTISDVIIHGLESAGPNEPASFIRRIVAVGGDTVQGVRGELLVNGEPSVALAIDPERPILGFGPVKIPAGEYFVMGDNYVASQDSRLHGPITADQIDGTVRWATKGWRG